VFAAAALFAWQPWHHPAKATGAPAATSEPGGGVAPKAEDASIAVLAFNNMSGDKDNEYFSDGISEELLNDLAQVPGLRVAARTSSFSFKGKNVEIQDIAKALNVHTVLEGSVRRVGNRVRITAQLINAADGYHVWSQDYDREIADIFAVQDEIAKAITHELTGRLLPAAAVGAAAKPKINPDAYTAYLQGRFFLAKRNNADLLRAVDFFKQAIALEPDYTDAHANLGWTYAILYLFGYSRDTLPVAKEETAATLRLDPSNTQALLTTSIIAGAEWNWLEAESSARRVIALNPNNAETLHTYAETLLGLNLPEAALAPAQRSAALDPLAPHIRSSVTDALYFQNRSAEAAVESQAILTLDPNFGVALVTLCWADVTLGKPDAAKDILKNHLVPIEGIDGPFVNLCSLFIAKRSGDLLQMKKFMIDAPRLYERGKLSASQVGLTDALAGDLDQAFRWLEKAYDERDPQFFRGINDPNLPANFKADPRWQALMQRPLLKEWQAVRTRVAAEFAAGK